MLIRKHYHGEDSAYDVIFNSFDEVKQAYLKHGETENWIDCFIGILQRQKKASDRFAEYAIESE